MLVLRAESEVKDNDDKNTDRSELSLFLPNQIVSKIAELPRLEVDVRVGYGELTRHVCLKQVNPDLFLYLASSAPDQHFVGGVTQ